MQCIDFLKFFFWNVTPVFPLLPHLCSLSVSAATLLSINSAKFSTNTTMSRSSMISTRIKPSTMPLSYALARTTSYNFLIFLTLHRTFFFGNFFRATVLLTSKSSHLSILTLDDTFDVSKKEKNPSSASLQITFPFALNSAQ